MREAYAHGKAVAAVGNASKIYAGIGTSVNSSLGVFAGTARAVVLDILDALAGPVRFPQRFPVDDPSICA